MGTVKVLCRKAEKALVSWIRILHSFIMSSVKNAPHPLLVKYLDQLSTHPLRTKACTTGMLTPLLNSDTLSDP